MSDIEPWLLLVSASVSVLARVMSQRIRTRRREARLAIPKPVATRHATLDHARNGDYVELRGELRPAAPLLAAPLSGEPCLGYVVVAHVWHSPKIPQLVADLRDGALAPAVLAVTGTDVIIDGVIEVAELEWPTARVARRSTDREAAFLTRHGLDRHLRSTEFEEGRIHGGDRAWVRGVLVREQAAVELGYREAPQQRVRLVAAPTQPLVIGRPRR